MPDKNDSQKSRDEYRGRIDRVVEYVIQHLGEDLSLATLADVACFSPWHFHRVFCALMDETPDDYVRRVRLEKSAVMLVGHKDFSVTDIAGRMGFSTSALFSRNFSRHFGMSPSEFRSRDYNRQTYSKNGQSLGNTGKGIDALDRYYQARNGKEVDRERAPIVTVRRLDPMAIAYVWHPGSYFAGVGGTIVRLGRWVQAHDLLRPETQIVGVGFDNPDITPEYKCRLLVGASVPKDADVEKLRGEGERAHVGFREIPGGLYASWRHVGTGPEMKFGYYRFYRYWLPDSGYVPATFEGFLRYDTEVRDLEKGSFAAEVCIPVIPF